MTPMTGFTDHDLDAVLDRAFELPPAERRAFLRREAGGRPTLLAAAERVLDESERHDGFLEPDEGGAMALRAAALGAGEPPPIDALQPGEVFASFEVLELAGRGGMGEVYRARDERLGRQVALKVLPGGFAEDPGRLARFDREAKVLASLNHPNIAAIYGLAEDGGRQALVLEFVEGTTLADRIRGGPIPVRDALPIARQVALALEAAHRRGIVHRDLKPANICLTADGTVKVLDFGLAKAVGAGVAPRAPALTSAAVPGALLGTPAYMAPEQARGLEADPRADVWAFGCIVYEMLTGTRAFEGETASDVLARVLEREPDFARLPPRTPPALERMLRRALTKDPARRLAGIGNALLDLEEAEAGARGRWPGGRRAAVLGGIAVAVLAIAGAAIGWFRWTTAEFVPPVRLSIPIAASDELLVSGQQVAALSPDGRTLVYRAIRNGRVGLFRRSLGSLTSDPIPGTENAAGPFFSPDGAWLGFDGDGALRKISLAGGAPVTICDAPGGANASWGGGVIVFATSTSRVLQRVTAAGGAPEPLTTLDRAAGDIAHAFPHVLPDGQGALFTIIRAGGPQIAVVDFRTRGARILMPGAQARYSSSGHLLFVRDTALWAVGFDPARREIVGTALPVIEGLDTAGGSAAHFAITDSGALLYAPRREEVPDRSIVWIDERGAEGRVPLEPRRFTRAALSPAGTHIAFAASDQGNTDIWIADVARGTSVRLTREPGADTAPLWSRDSRFVAFRSERNGGGVFLARADGAGEVARLTASQGTFHTPHDWTPDGRTLLFTEFRSYTQQAIAAVDLAEPLEVRRLLDGPFAQLRPHVSPDGRWLAYQSDESGRFEIYVRPYPDVRSGRWQVSKGGGTSPRWSNDGARLFYYDGTGISAARIEGSAAFAAGTPARLFAYTPFSGRMGPDFDVTGDGRRFLMIRNATDTPSSRVQLVLIQEWIPELRRKLAGE